MGILQRACWLLALAAGCGDDVGPGGGSAGGGTPDGGNGGAGGAGGAGTQATTEIAVEVVDQRGYVVAGVDVLAHSADGALASRSLTAMDGTTSIVMPLGGTVSVLFERHNALLEEPERFISSLAPPAGRSALRFVAHEAQADDVASEPMGPIVLDIPIEANESVSVTGSCGPVEIVSKVGESGVTLVPYRGCPGHSTFDLFLQRTSSLAGGAVFSITATAAVTGQPFTPGEGIELALEWEPAALSETIWTLTDTEAGAEASSSSWWLEGNAEPYALVPDLSQVGSFGPLQNGTFTQGSLEMPAETHCVALYSEQVSASACTGHSRIVCGPSTPSSVDWSVHRLAVAALSEAGDAWTFGEGDEGDYIERRAIAPSDDAGIVVWSLQLGPEATSAPSVLELPDDLASSFGFAAGMEQTRSLSTVDDEGVEGFDAALDAHGVLPERPGWAPVSREYAALTECAD